MFDNGDTRVSPPTGPGSSTGCLAGIGPPKYSRGMSVTFDENRLQVTPVLSVDLDGYSIACGSAQLLDDGSYYFLSPTIYIASQKNEFSQAIEILPASGTGGGTQVLNIQGPNGYRGWQMPSLYNPPTT